MILDSIQFNDFVKICSGEFLRTPLLPFIDQKHYDRKCLIIGSCLANYILKKEIRFPSQLLIFNGGNLPNISGHIDNFDFVVVQMPLRYMLKDFELWNEGALDLDACEQVFNDAKVRLEHFFYNAISNAKISQFF